MCISLVANKDFYSFLFTTTRISFELHLYLLRDFSVLIENFLTKFKLRFLNDEKKVILKKSSITILKLSVYQKLYVTKLTQLAS